MATNVSVHQLPVHETNSQDEESSNLQFYADNFDRLCRLCLSSDQLVSIYSNVQGRNVYYVRKFMKHALDLLSVKINIHDKLPQFVCERCEHSLSVIFNFKKKCDKSLAILQRVRDSIIKRTESGNVDPEEAEKEPKVQRRRKRKPVSKQLSCEEILKKLPAAINVEKRLSSVETCMIEPDTRHESAQETNEPADSIKTGTEETHALDGVLHYPGQEHEVLHEDSKRDHSEEQGDPNGYLEDQHISDVLKIEGEFIELLEVAEDELEIEKSKSNGRRRVVCPICGAMVNNVKSHLITHSDVRPHQCDQCPKSFATRNKLQSHTNSVHLRKRDFKCDICGKAFLEKNNLKGHMRIHSGERKYTCDICAKSFLFAGTLRCHKLTHTQEKKHECQICGKLFLMRTTLNKHLNVHTGDRPHKCDLCDKRFRTSTHKVVHMRTHTGEKPLVCYICEMSFAHHKARSVHMKSKHPEELARMGLIDDKGHLKI